MRYLKHTLLAVSFILIGCSEMEGKKEPLKGDRLSAYAVTSPVIPDASIATKKYSIPTMVSTTWSASKYPSEVMGNNLELSITKLKRAREYKLTTSRYSSITTPIVAGNNIFTVNNAGSIQAIDTSTGKAVWKNNDLLKSPALTKLLDHKKMVFGGMLYHKGKIFLTAGFKGVLAVDANSGKTLWCKELSTMVRGVPIHADGKIIVQAANNNVFALDETKGDLVWSYWGIKGSGITPLDPPILAIYKNKIISSQAGNALHAIDLATGEAIWESLFYEAYEDGADPFVVSANQMQLALLGKHIYAIHPAGRIMAIDPDNGGIIWSQDLDTGMPFWIAGDLLFTTTKGENLVAIDRYSGKMKWAAALVSFVPAPKKGKTAITWLQQPIVAGGEVLLASSNGQLHRFDYNDGSHLGAITAHDSASFPPVIANGQLFMLSKDGVEQLIVPKSK